MGEKLDIHVTHEGDRLAVLTATGDLDMSTAGEFHAAAAAALSDGADRPAGTRDLVVDLAGVRFCDSSGFNALLRVQRRVLELSGRFALAAPPRTVSRLLALTGADEIFVVHPTREQAIDALRA